MPLPETHEAWTARRTSQLMLDLAELPGDGGDGQGEGDSVTVEAALRYMRGRAFGMALVLLAIVSVLPNLFGHTIVSGGLIALLGLQLALGFDHVRLPGRVLRRGVPRERVRQVMAVAAPRIARIERMLRPRLIPVTEDLGRRLIGVVVIPLAVLIAIPLPFTNAIPSLAILVLALGMIEKDGLVVLVGLGTAIAAGVFVGRIVLRVVT